MSSLFRITESYRNILVAVPAAGQDVCRTCWRDTRGPRHCRRCQEHLVDAPHLLADIVVPIALAQETKQFAHELRLYKDGRPDVRRRLQRQLAAVLAEFLHRHEGCLATAAKVPSFDLVTTVPSTKGRSAHPLAHMLSRSIQQTGSRYVNALAPAADAPQDRTLRITRFTTAVPVAGRTVLLVDDTWTTGARMQSACARLKADGATRVAGLVLGRWFDAEYAPSKAYLSRASSEPFTWERCCLGRSGLARC